MFVDPNNLSIIPQIPENGPAVPLILQTISPQVEESMDFINPNKFIMKIPGNTLNYSWNLLCPVSSSWLLNTQRQKWTTLQQTSLVFFSCRVVNAISGGGRLGGRYVPQYVPHYVCYMYLYNFSARVSESKFKPSEGSSIMATAAPGFFCW